MPCARRIPPLTAAATLLCAIAILADCRSDSSRSDTAAPATAAGTAPDTEAASADSDDVIQPPPPAAKGDTLWLFARTPTGDPVRLSDSEADLVARYGAANVARDTIPAAEGEQLDATVLFPDDSVRRLEIVWEDPTGRQRPRFAGTDVPGSRWMAYPGVGIGTCMEEIEALNGGPFSLYGYNWDYSGTASGWNGGRLDTLWASTQPASVIVRFARTRSSSGRVSGERVFSTANPAMRATRPCVRELLVRPR